MVLQKLLDRRVKKGLNFKNIYSEKEISFIIGEMIKFNKEGVSMTKLSEKYKIARGTLRVWMHKDDYTVVNQQNKLNVREDLFSTIETEEDAYWLGFIYADGYISDGGIVEISLKSTDSAHLLKLASFCHFDKSKVVLKQAIGEYFRCRLSFATQHLKRNFTKHGVVSRKSLILTFPKFLRGDLVRHFIRGYFDGDGCISKIRKPRSSKHKSRDFSVTVLGTENFLKDLNQVCPLEKKNIRKRNNIYILAFNSKEAFKFIDYLYKNSTIYLDRKFKKYTEEIAPLYSDI